MRFRFVCAIAQARLSNCAATHGEKRLSIFSPCLDILLISPVQMLSAWTLHYLIPTHWPIALLSAWPHQYHSPVSCPLHGCLCGYVCVCIYELFHYLRQSSGWSPYWTVAWKCLLGENKRWSVEFFMLKYMLSPVWYARFIFEALFKPYANTATLGQRGRGYLTSCGFLWPIAEISLKMYYWK